MRLQVYVSHQNLSLRNAVVCFMIIFLVVGCGFKAPGSKGGINWNALDYRALTRKPVVVPQDNDFNYVTPFGACDSEDIITHTCN